MNTRWKSPAGWGLLAAYLILAGFLFRDASTCAGWGCDLAALPAVFPFGFAVAWLYDGIDHLFVLPDLTAGLLRKWHFILPTVIGNAIFYFWVGSQLEKLVTWLYRRSTKQR